MTEQNDAKTGELLDESTARRVMSYYRIDNHDELARYIRHMGIEHNDSLVAKTDHLVKRYRGPCISDP